VLTFAATASRVGRIPASVRRWIREARVRAIEDERYPMSRLPDEWKTSDDGSPAPNWVAALHRSRAGH
jgi:transposase-like protein